MSLMQLCQEAARTTRARAAAGAEAASGSGAGGRAPKRRGDGAKSPTTARRQAPKPKLLGVTAGADGLARCPWSAMYSGAGSDAYIRYHDEEWGRPCRDDAALFELLVLEGAQAGLSWAMILGKRAAYREGFAGFDPSKVAAFGDAEVERLMAPESGVVRHKGKILSAINNARCVVDIQRRHGSFSDWVWSHAGPGGTQIVNVWREMSQVPTRTDASEALSEALKREGCTFVGPTTCYSFMQAAGLVNDHLVGCFCYSQCTAPGGSGGAGGAPGAGSRGGAT